MEQLVFLQPSPGQYIPHFLYCLEIYPAIMLVMVAEHGNLQNLASQICHTLGYLEATGIFTSVGKPAVSGSQNIHDLIEDSIRY